MARHSRVDVINAVLEAGLVPVFYHNDAETAIKVVNALAEAGVHAVEFTNRGDFAWRVFEEMERHFSGSRPEIILGTGSIVDAPTAALYIANGTNFIVGPNYQEDIARLCNRRKIAYMPGCANPTELSRAEESGCEICKIFPGNSIGGPEFVKSVLAPCPWTRIMPTGGVNTTKKSITEWISSGAACLGIGSKLISGKMVEAGDFKGITKKAKDCLRWIEEARRSSKKTGR